MRDFAEFWPVYLRAHRSPTNRGFHYLATIVGTSGPVAALWLGDWRLFALAIAAAYGLALSGHLMFERNRPLILQNPLWGAASDLRMFALAATGRLAREYQRIRGPASL